MKQTQRKPTLWEQAQLTDAKIMAFPAERPRAIANELRAQLHTERGERE